MDTVSKGPGRLQAIKEELARVQDELDETATIRKEAEAEDDPELIAECKVAEDRLKGLVSELTAEVARLQKPSGAGALRARLRQLQTSEARARSVLGSGELPAAAAAEQVAVDAHHIKEKTPLDAPGPASAAGPGLPGPLPAAEAALAQSLSQTPAAAPAKPAPDIGLPISTATPDVGGGPQLSMGTVAALPEVRNASALPPAAPKGVSAAASQSGSQSSGAMEAAALPKSAAGMVPKKPVVGAQGNGSSTVGTTSDDPFEAAFGKPSSSVAASQGSKPAASDGSTKKEALPAGADLGAASIAASQWSRNSSASLQNHPQQSSQASLDSIADSTLSDPSSVKANAAKAPASAEDGFGGSAFRLPESKEVGKKPATESADFGFGESAFVLPGPSKPAPVPSGKGLSGEGVDVTEAGKSISLRDSFPTRGNATKAAAEPKAASSGWQAFDAAPKNVTSGELPPLSAGSSAEQPGSAAKQVEFRGLGSGGFSSSGSGGFTSSTAFPPRSATHSPTPSARSGNPFQEFNEQGGAQEAGDKATAGLSEGGSASGQSMGIQNWPSQGSMGGVGASDGFETFSQQLAPPSLGPATQPQQPDSFAAFPDPFAPPVPSRPAPQAPASGQPAPLQQKPQQLGSNPAFADPFGRAAPVKPAAQAPAPSPPQQPDSFAEFDPFSAPAPKATPGPKPAPAPKAAPAPAPPAAGSSGQSFVPGPGGLPQGSGSFGQGSGSFEQGPGSIGQGSVGIGQGSGGFGQGSGGFGQGSVDFGQGSGGFGQGPGAAPHPFGAASSAPHAVPIKRGPNSVPQRAPVAGNSAFGGSPAASHFPHLSDASGHSFLVTPSIVIPEADWDAAFAPAKPAKAAEEALVGTPSPLEAVEDAEAAEDIGDESVWVPMTDHDRGRCEQAFKTKFAGEEGSGVRLAQARELYARAEIRVPLEEVYALSDIDHNGTLSYAEFLLFMYLLKVLRKGAKLPRALTRDRISYLLGKDLGSLGSAGPQPQTQPPPKQQPSPATDAASSAVPMDASPQLRSLISLGASREDAKRALFLNGDDVDTAANWLAERKALGNSNGDGNGMQASSSPPSSSTTGLEKAGSAVNDSGPDGPRMAIRVDKALLQYKKPVDRPLFSIAIRDPWGEALEPTVDTPPCHFDKGLGVFQAGHTVYLKTPINKLPEGAVMYFELKHWKSKEKKWSTLGWTFVHKESLVRLVDGHPQVRVESQGLHLYEKPLDPRSHFRQASMRKLKPLSDTPDLFINISEALQ